MASALTVGLTLDGGPIDSSHFTSNATVITFGNLTGGNCNLCGPSVTNQYAALGVTFNNPSYPGEDTADTNLVPFFPDSSAPNALYVYQGGLIGQAPAAPFQILFSIPVTSVGFDYGSSIDSFLELEAYGTDNQLLGTLIFVGNPAPIGLEGFAGIGESTPIARLDISYHPDTNACRTLNFSIDDLEFEAGSVPEPSTLALIAAGLSRDGCRARAAPGPALMASFQAFVATRSLARTPICTAGRWDNQWRQSEVVRQD